MGFCVAYMQQVEHKSFRGYFALSRPRSEGLDPPSPLFWGVVLCLRSIIHGISNSFGPSFVGLVCSKQVTGPYGPEKIVGVFSFEIVVVYLHGSCFAWQCNEFGLTRPVLREDHGW